MTVETDKGVRYAMMVALTGPGARATLEQPLADIVEDDTLASTIATRTVLRLATERLFQIDERREVGELLRRGWSQRKIANAMSTTQPRIHRIQKMLQRTGGEVSETPEEIILRALVDHTSRRELVARLKSLEYTFGERAPYPMEGTSPGSWDDIEHARFEGWLTPEEYGEIRAAVASQ